VNDLTDTKTLAHLLRHDSVHGHYNGTVEARDNALVVDGDEIRVLSERTRRRCPGAISASTSYSSARAASPSVSDAAKHLDAGARKVIISAPAKNEDITIVLGVNHESYDAANHHVISNASCTTNCLAPVVKVLLDEFGFKRGSDDHGACVHQRPADPRSAAQGPAPCAGCCGVHHPDHHRSGEGDGTRAASGEGEDRRDGDARAHAGRVHRRPHVRARA
jgi:glyceraldehyde-3-phosphate dehydrogenase type I